MYPPAPWKLQGFAFQTLHLVDCDRAHSFIPPDLSIVQVFPNKTLGGVYVSSYGAGSVLQYNELIVVPALVRHKDKVGIWISHIYVDNLDSVAGGRNIWGLPKEMAEFDWEYGTTRNAGKPERVTVRQGDRLLCAMNIDWNFSLWRQHLAGAGLSVLGSDFLQFGAEADANLAIVNARLTIPPESFFADLNLGKPWFSAAAESLNLAVDEPKVIGQKLTPQRKGVGADA